MLDSRYQRSGDKFRFTLRLLRVSDGATLWADTLDHPAVDLFAIEDALSAKVTGRAQPDAEWRGKRTAAETLYQQRRRVAALRQRPPPDASRAGFRTSKKPSPTLSRRSPLITVSPSRTPLLGYSYASLTNLGHSPPKDLHA